MSAIEQMLVNWRNEAQRPTYDQLMAAANEHVELLRLVGLMRANHAAIRDQLETALKLANQPPLIDETGKARHDRRSPIGQRRQTVADRDPETGAIVGRYADELVAVNVSTEQVKKAMTSQLSKTGRLIISMCRLLEQIEASGAIARHTPLGWAIKAAQDDVGKLTASDLREMGS